MSVQLLTWDALQSAQILLDTSVHIEHLTYHRKHPPNMLRYVQYRRNRRYYS